VAFNSYSSIWVVFDLLENLGVTFNRSNSICLKALVDTTISFSLLSKVTHTLFSFAEILGVAKERKEFDDFIPAESRLRSAFRRIAFIIRILAR
jgi:hypothetical protein